MRKRSRIVVMLGLAALFMSVGCLALSGFEKLGRSDSLVVNAATTFVSGNGSVSSPYIIDSFDTLNGANATNQFRGHVNANVNSASVIYYRLSADITMTGAWTPIPRLGPNMVFDGDGHTITGMNITSTNNAQGFIANLQGTVQNVNFTNVNIAENTSATNSILRGAVAATVDRTATSGVGSTVIAKIENVHVLSGNIGGTRAGGLVGGVGITTANANGNQTTAQSVKLSIINSSNNAKVSSSTSQISSTTPNGNGGLVGYAYRAVLNIEGSYNSGTVMMVSSGVSVGVGGLIGAVYETATTATDTAQVNISTSYNTGIVSFTRSIAPTLPNSITSQAIGNTHGGARATNRQAAGGLIGLLFHTSTNASYRIGLTINASYNTGLVQLVAWQNYSDNAGPTFSATNNIYAVGGLVGIMEGVGTSSKPAKIENSYNTGSLRISTYTGNLHLLVAGIVPRVYYSYLSINSCYNTGSMYGNGYTGGSVNMAGIVAHAPVSSNLANSQTPANNQSTINISHCANTGVSSGNGNAPNASGIGFPDQGIGPGTGATITDSGSTTGSGPGSGAGQVTVEDIIDSINDVISTYYSHTVTAPTVTPAGSYTFATNHVNNQVSGGEPFKFTLTFDPTYNLSPTLPGFSVKLTGVEPDIIVTGSHVSGNTWEYTTPALYEDKTIVVSGVTENKYSITYSSPSNFTYVANPASILHITNANTFEFVVQMSAGYDSAAPTATVGGTKFTGVPNGTARQYKFTVASANLYANSSGVIAVVVAAPVANSYGVTLSSGTGYTLTGSSTATHGQAYSFTYAPTTGYRTTSLVVKVGGSTISTPTPVGTTYTIPAGSVIGAIDVSAAVARDTFSVTLPSSQVGYTLTGTSGPAAATYGQPYSFNFSLNTGYTNSIPTISITVGGSSISTPTPSGSTYTVPGASVTGNIVITVNGVNPNAFNVTLPSPQVGYTLTGNSGAGAASYNTAYAFNFALSTGYTNSNPTISITVGGSAITTPTPVDGTYTIPAASVTGAIVILVSGVAGNTLGVTLPSSQVGYVLTGSSSVVYNSAYSFNFSVNTGYDGSLSNVSITVGGLPISNSILTVSNNTYTIPGASVTGSIVISVSGVVGNTLSVAKNSNNDNGITWTRGNATATYGSTYSFSFVLNDGYTNSTTGIAITIGGSTIPTPTPNDGVYTIPASSVTGAIIINLTGVVGNTLTVTKTSNNNTGITWRSGNTTAIYDSAYSFSFSLNAGYTNSTTSVDITAGGSTIPTPTPIDGVYTIPAGNVTGAIVINITGIVGNTLTVTKNSNNNAGISWTSGNATAIYGSAYSFSFSLNTGYTDSTPSVSITIGGTTLTPTPTPNGSGVYTIPAGSVTGNIQITVSGISSNTFSVSLSSGGGYTLNGGSTATFGTAYTFAFELDSGYSTANPDIIVYIGGTHWRTLSKTDFANANNEYTIPIANVTGAIEVIVSAVAGNEYNVNFSSGLGYTILGESTATFGESYSFSVQLLTGWTNSSPTVTIRAGATTLSLGTHYSVSGGTYTINGSSITGVISITVSNVVRNTLTVSLPTGNGYTLTGNATASYGLNYVFTFAIDTGWTDSNPTVTVRVGSTNLSLGTHYSVNNGVYTINSTYVTDTITVTVGNVNRNTLDVNLPTGQVGYTLSGSPTTLYGLNYSFTFAVSDGYKQNSSALVTIKVGNSELVLNTHYTVNGGTYTITSTYVTDTITVTVSGIAGDTLVVNKPTTQNGFTLTGNNTAVYGTDYKFSFAIDANYNQSNATVVIKVGDTTLTINTGYTVSNGTYTILGNFVTDEITITVNGVVGNPLSVTLPSSQTGYSLTGGTSVAYGSDYVFNFSKNTGYDNSTAVILITIGGVPFATPTPSGTRYTIPGSNVIGAIVITVSGVVGNTLEVDLLPALSGRIGYTLTGSSSAVYGSSYTFNFSVDSNYNQSNPTIAITIGGQAFATPTPSGTAYTISGANVTGKIVITISNVSPNRYSVTLPATRTGYELIGTSGANAATYNVAYSFTFSLLTGYTKSAYDIQVTVGGTTVVPVVNGITYTIPAGSVNGAIVVTVSGVTENTYNVNVPTHAGYTVKNGNGSANAATTAVYGTNYEFIISLQEGYTNSTPIVSITIGGTAYTPSVSGGKYTISGTSILGDIIISVNSSSIVHNSYTVSVVDAAGLSGFTVSGPTLGSATHGTSYEFTVSFKTGFTQSSSTYGVAVTIGGINYTPVAPVGTTFTIAGESILGDIVITVSNVVYNKYSVDITPNTTAYPMSDPSFGTITINTALDGGKIVHGGSVSFTIAPKPHFLVVGLVINGSLTPYSELTYTRSNITADLTVYPVFKEEQKYRVHFYSNGTTLFYISDYGYEGDAVNVPVSTPHRSGYKITGWSTQPNGGGVQYGLDLRLGNEPLKYIANEEGLKMYAIWGETLDYTIETTLVGSDRAAVSPGKMAIGKSFYLSAVSFTLPVDSANWYVQNGGGWVLLSLTGRTVNIVGIFTEDFLALYEQPDGAGGYKLVFKHEIIPAPITYSIEADFAGNGQISYVVGSGTSALLVSKQKVDVVQGSNVTITITPDVFHEIKTLKRGSTFLIQDGALLSGSLQNGPNGIKYYVITIPSISDDQSISVTFTPKKYTVRITLLNSSGTSLAGTPSNYVNYPTTVSFGGKFELSLNNSYLAGRNLALLEYTLLNNAGYTDPLADTIGIYTCSVDKSFLDSYENGGFITLYAQFVEKRNISVQLNANDILNGTIYVDWFDPSFGSEGDYRKLETSSLPFGTQVKITINPKQNYVIKWDEIEGTLSRFDHHNEGNVLYLVLTENLNLTISFKAPDTYTVILQLRDADGNYRGIADKTFTNVQSGETPVNNFVLPEIEYFKFSKWYVVANGVKVFEITDGNDGFILTSIGIDSFTLTPGLISRLGGINYNEIYILAEYAIETRLDVSVVMKGGQSLDGNGYVLSINGGEERTLSSAEVLPYGAIVIITAKPSSSHYKFIGFFDENDVQITTGVSGNVLTITMGFGRQIRLVFEPATYNIVNVKLENASGTIEFTINGVAYSDLEEAKRNIRIGDTITINYTSNNGYQLNKLTMTNGSKTASVRNGEVIYVTSDWLGNWLTNSKLDIKVKAETQMATTILVGIGGASIIIPLAITLSVLYIIAIKRKKKDYLIALERSRQSSARLQASQVMSDIMKQARGGE